MKDCSTCRYGSFTLTIEGDGAIVTTDDLKQYDLIISSHCKGCKATIVDSYGNYIEKYKRHELSEEARIEGKGW